MSGQPPGGRESEIVFLGTSGAIRSPAHFCTCEVCEEARADAGLSRTRASIALVGREVTVVDPSPDLEGQLEREAIRRIDRIFITHWHSDHVGGIGMIGELRSCARWPKIDVHLPSADAYHFKQELSFLAGSVELHPHEVGDVIALQDARWRVVKTNHTDTSVGYVIEGSRRVAYLVDGATPPQETAEVVRDADVLALEAVLDEKDTDWRVGSLPEALDFWRKTNAPECIVTHLSCHRWRSGRLIAGLSAGERRRLEHDTPGLHFARDGDRIPL